MKTPCTLNNRTIWFLVAGNSLSGLNLSAYRTITVELGNDNTSSVSFRIFDKNNYWTEPAAYDFGSSRKVIVDLQNMKEQERKQGLILLIYTLSGLSTGNKPIIINRII